MVKYKDGYQILTVYNGTVIELMNSYEWYIWLRDIKNSSPNTIISYMASMTKFWVYSLYVAPSNDKFKFYLANYRKNLLSGYSISVKQFDTLLKDEMLIVVSESTPKEKSTINKDMVGISSYFTFSEESNLIYNEKYINYLYEKHKSKNSFLSSIEIKKSKNALETFGSNPHLVKPYKTVDSNTRKAFPMELFDELLDLANDRQKLIYILCGICSARIGQCLNLTSYDIDFNNNEVWLISPKSDAKDIYGNSRRKWLLQTYDIDTAYTYPHCAPDLQFKYPIPLHHSPLYWLADDKYKPIFFQSFFKYFQSENYVKEHQRKNKHPFVFVTRSGERLRKSNVSKSFKSHLKQLIKKHPEYENKLNSLDVHSLRHMFGTVLAEHYVISGDEALILYTKEAMGHSALTSTMRYFNVTQETIKIKLQEASNTLFNNTQKAIKNV